MDRHDSLTPARLLAGKTLGRKMGGSGNEVNKNLIL
jgi:hypothetical protein